MKKNSRFVIAFFLSVMLCTAAEPRLIDSKKIWDAGPHNAFTDLIRHDNQWLCVFREADGHVAPGGKIRIIGSKDGQTWTSVALLSEPNLDLRDPHIIHAPDGQLMLYAAAADRPKTPVTHVSKVWFSKDARSWTAPAMIGETNNWIWRIAWNRQSAYAVGYSAKTEKYVRLYKSSDGKTFETLVPTLRNEEHPNESGLDFDAADTLYCLLRRDGKPGNGLFGISKPPYTNWTWQDIGAKIGGPKLLILPDGRFIAGIRLYDGGARTSIASIDPANGKLTELLKLPSGGDCSYPGLVWHENQLWVSYYSSHEGKTQIYLARVAL